MKSLLLATVALAGFAISQAQASVMITGTESLPNASLILAPTADVGSVGFGIATADHYDGSTQDARSPFDGVTGYTNSSFAYVAGGGSATFSKSNNPSFVTGGDTFSFILGSPDTYNSLVFSNGETSTTITGTELLNTFEALTNNAPAGTGYYVATISGLGNYSSVTFESSQNSIEFATFNVSAVPLPASLPLFGGALLGMGVFAFARKRSAKSAAAV